jgi:hypothetical protein
MQYLGVNSDREQHGMAAPASTPTPPDPALVDADEFATAFGESLRQTLDLDTWQPGENLAALYNRLQAEIEDAVRQENRIREQIRRELFPRLRTRPGAPANAGVWHARLEDIERIHGGILFNGVVEACDGTSAVHDTLPITIAQLGVCLVSYQGGQGSWVNRLYRRDLRIGGLDPVGEALEMLERRQRRTGFDASSQHDRLSELARRGIMAYAERAVLLHKSRAPWRLGHGSPTPWELLTGSGMPELADASLDLLHRLITGHKRFIFVPSGPAERMLLTIGNALHPLEYAIVDTMRDTLERTASGHYRGTEWGLLFPRVQQFAADVGDQIVKGVYRASHIAPPQLFYAHIDHVHEAALIALADSVLQGHRGFPLLIDLAHTICSEIFGAGTLTASTQLAYTEAGAPFRYLTERQTRR